MRRVLPAVHGAFGEHSLHGDHGLHSIGTVEQMAFIHILNTYNGDNEFDISDNLYNSKVMKVIGHYDQRI